MFLSVLAWCWERGDADYYHAYAEGEVEYAIKIWPVLLRGLAEVGFYDRQGVTFLLFFLSSIFIPFVFSSIVARQVQLGWFSSRVFWHSVILVAIYPTVYFFSFDIYRDVLMYSIFLLAMYCLAEYLLPDKRQVISFFLLGDVFWSFYFLLFFAALFGFFSYFIIFYLQLYKFE